MSGKTKLVRTSLEFGEDGTFALHNITLGDPNTHCEEDVADFNELMQVAGVQILQEQSLSCDPTPTAETQLTNRAPEARTGRREVGAAQTSQTVKVQGG